jgi:hypothetical protein
MVVSGDAAGANEGVVDRDQRRLRDKDRKRQQVLLVDRRSAFAFAVFGSCTWAHQGRMRHPLSPPGVILMRRRRNDAAELGRWNVCRRGHRLHKFAITQQQEQIIMSSIQSTRLLLRRFAPKISSRSICTNSRITRRLAQPSSLRATHLPSSRIQHLLPRRAFSASRTCREEASAPSTTTEPQRADVPSYDLTFTCKKCNDRSTHRVSKQGYHNGTVLITCPGCHNRHLIADHLKVSYSPLN